jgi:hypothetical protein
MLDLGIGSYLDMIERRWGRFWSGLLMLVVYLAVMAVCLPIIWQNLVVPMHTAAVQVVDSATPTINALGNADTLLRTPTVGWHEVLRQFIALIVIGIFATVAVAIYAVLLTLGLVIWAKFRGKPLDHYVRRHNP